MSDPKEQEWWFRRLKFRVVGYDMQQGSHFLNVPSSGVQKTTQTSGSYKPRFLESPLSWALESEFKVLMFVVYCTKL